jgi:AcrR family transcriptional regulator
MILDPPPPQVKRRPYDSSARVAQALRSREAVLDAARVRFLSHGVHGTSIAAIADDAGVSVDTVYKAFRSKAGVLRALCERALEGAGPVPAETRSDELQEQEVDGRAVLRGLGTLTAEVAPRIAPMLLLLSAGGSPELDRLRAELDAARLERMTQVAERLARHHHLRPGTPISEAAEVLWAYSSPELFGLLVVQRGWTPERYGVFIGDALAVALLGEHTE